MVLHIDLETFSSVNLKKAGLYKYVQSPDFEILLFAYAYDNDPVTVIDMAQGEKLTEQLIYDLKNPEVIKMAHNAAFEFYCLSKFYVTKLEQWRCSMVHALYCGYPASLDAVGEAMNFPQDKKKLGIGRSLIKFFCVPCKPTNKNDQRTRNLPKHDLKRWKLFKEYCRQDVVTERTIEDALSFYPVPETEWVNWRIDQLININGVAMDIDLIKGALAISDSIRDELEGRAKDITGLDNPNSVAQLKTWIEQNSDLELNG